MLVTLFLVLFQFRFETTNHFFHFSHRPAIREISLIRVWVVEQIIAKAEMIEANATNMIWNRKSKERRKRRRKRKRKSRSCEWKSWWESWLQRDVENVWHFAWRIDRFLWQSRTTKRYRFRERMLLKIFRIRAFQTLTNRCLLIDCKHEVKNYSWLIKRAWLTRWTNVKTLRRSKIFSMLT